MSYKSMALNATDQAFIDRVTACIAQEQTVRDDPVNPMMVLGEVLWNVVAASDVEAAYASALAADNPDPGGDETVITDAMILAHVQADWPAP